MYEDEQRRSQRTKERGAGGRVGVSGLGIQGEVSRSAVETSETTLRQHRSSKFDRLHRMLEEQDAVQSLIALDEAIWDQLEVGELVEVSAQISFPGLKGMKDLARQAKTLAGFMRSVGADDEIDNETLSQIDAFDELSPQQPDELQIIASVAAVPRFKIVAKLRQQCLTRDESELEGEATVVAKIQRKFEKGERESLVDIPGVQATSRKERRKLESELKKLGKSGAPIGEMSVSYPGAVVTAVAVYR